MTRRRSAASAALLAALVLSGCGTDPAKPTTDAGAAPADKTTANRAKLDPADRELADAQGWCAVETDNRLGAMGTPVKVEVKGQPVFLCCKGCKKAAEADPDKTLAAVAELKTKAKADKPAKN